MQDQLPQDIQGLASELEALGEHERRAAEDAVVRTTMRTTHLLTEPHERAPTVSERWGRLWFWIAAPAVAAAAVIVAVFAVSPAGQTADPNGGVEVLAASIENDIDTWAELDAIWSKDSFETSLAALSINAAGIQTQTDSFESLPDLDGDL